MNPRPALAALVLFGLCADATLPPAGTLATRGPVGSASQALVLGTWAMQADTAIIPAHAQVLVCRRKFLGGRVTDEFQEPIYLGSVTFVSVDANGKVPGSAAPWPVLTLWLDATQAWQPSPPLPPPFNPTPANSVTPLVVPPSLPITPRPADGTP